MEQNAAAFSAGQNNLRRSTVIFLIMDWNKWVIKASNYIDSHGFTSSQLFKCQFVLHVRMSKLQAKAGIVQQRRSKRCHSNIWLPQLHVWRRSPTNCHIVCWQQLAAAKPSVLRHTGFQHWTYSCLQYKTRSCHSYWLVSLHCVSEDWI